MKKKIYFYKIYELKNGSQQPVILRDCFSAASNKKEAFEEAKNELFRIAKLEFPCSCIKKDFEDLYFEALENGDCHAEALEALENQYSVFFNIYDNNRITGIDDDITEPAFCRGDVSYSSSRDASAVYLKVFSKKVKQ